MAGQHRVTMEDHTLTPIIVCDFNQYAVCAIVTLQWVLLSNLDKGDLKC